MKNKTMRDSVLCALRGLILALRTEKNFRYYAIHVLVTLPINLLLGFSAREHLIWGVCVAGVFSSECVNTALERICDLMTEGYDERIKAIKDIAAGAVLCWGIAFYITEIIALGGKLLG